MAAGSELHPAPCMCEVLCMRRHGDTETREERDLNGGRRSAREGPKMWLGGRDNGRQSQPAVTDNSPSTSRTYNEALKYFQS